MDYSKKLSFKNIAIQGQAKQVSIIFHDNLIPEIVIPIHDKIKYIFGLTEWHADQIKNSCYYQRISSTFRNCKIRINHSR